MGQRGQCSYRITGHIGSGSEAARRPGSLDLAPHHVWVCGWVSVWVCVSISPRRICLGRLLQCLALSPAQILGMPQWPRSALRTAFTSTPNQGPRGPSTSPSLHSEGRRPLPRTATRCPPPPLPRPGGRPAGECHCKAPREAGHCGSPGAGGGGGGAGRGVARKPEQIRRSVLPEVRPRSSFGEEPVNIACPPTVGTRISVDEWDGCPSAHRRCFCACGVQRGKGATEPPGPDCERAPVAGTPLKVPPGARR